MIGPRVFVIERAGGNAKTTITRHIAFAAARETAVIVADASRVVLTRCVGILGVVLQFGKFGHEYAVIDERNIWIGLITCAVFRALL